METLVAVQCLSCKQFYSLEVNQERYDRWRAGEGLIQNMLPELDADCRELLVTQTCGTCFDRLFT